ncbi:MAG: gliding motility-associated protein GldE [Lachnospiraceae bacterium]|nr:gliding motility-associated protein GldE [Lachnospiraceae bacterium]
MDMLCMALSAITPEFGAPQIASLFVAALCLMASGFISGSEIAFFSLTESQIDELDEEQALRIRSMLAKPERLLATILIGNNLVNVTIVVLTNFALGALFTGMAPWMSFVLQSVILTFLILLFGEILPKLYATNNTVKWALFAQPTLQTLVTLFRPISGMLVRSTSIVNRVVTNNASINADELSQALDLTDVQATDDKQMLEGILKFGDTTASEIMTPRVEIVGIDYASTFDQVLAKIVETGYSRLPVYDDTMDNIKGVLYSRDMLPHIGKPLNGFDWHTLLREAYYVPESRQIDDLLEDFRKLKKHIAIVIDEYGGTQGVVTLEDVLEEIVGDINDEYDEDEQYFTRLSPDTYNFEGRTPLTDFFRITGLDEEEFADVTEDAETLAGMLLTIKGDFPKDKEPLAYGRCRFLVLKVAEHRIVSVRVNIKTENIGAC